MKHQQFLQEELNNLDRLIKINSANLKKFKDLDLDQTLIASSSHGCPQFKVRANVREYSSEEIYTNRSYVSNGDLGQYKKLIQKQYEERLNKALLANRSRLERFIKNYDYDFVDKVYQKSAFARKQFISPIIEPIDEYIKDWLESHPGGMNPYDDPPDLETERGEFVRTKSEKILADTFYKLGIPYQYEPEFVLNTGYCKYPDFILLNVIRRKTYYWEHMGLTDEHGYATKNFKKLLTYERNGLILGDNLIISLETDDMPLDMKMVHKKIQDYLL